MTLAAVEPRIVFTGTGTRGPFALNVSGSPLRFTDNAHIRATRYSTAGVATVLVEGVNYDLGGGPDAGTLTLRLTEAVLAVGETLIVERSQAFAQNLSLATPGSFPSASVEARLDKIVEYIQDLDARDRRSWKAHPLDTAAPAAPSVAARASKAAGWDSSGNLIPITSGLSGTPVTAFGASLVDDVDAAAGRATLGMTAAGSALATAASAAAQRVALGLRLFLPEDYGAVGDGVTNDRAAVQAAIDAAAAAGGGVVLLSRTYAMLTGATVTSNRVQVVGLGAHTGFTGLGSSTITLLSFTGSGPSGTAKTLTAAPAKGDRAVTLNNVTGISVGSLLQFTHTPVGTPSAVYIWHGYVKSIATNTVTLTTPLPIAISLSDTCSVQVINVLSQVGARNFRSVRGTNTGVDTSGVAAQYVAESYFGDLWFEDIPALGFSAYYGIDNQSGPMWLERSGSAGYSDWNVAGQTNFLGGPVVSHRATGFGPKPQQCTYGSFAPITSIDANGRGVKISHCLHNHFAALRAHGASFTGVGFTEGSCHNTIDYAEALRNGNEGLWFSDQGNCDNHVRGYRAFGNVGNHIGIFPSDLRNVVEGIDLGSDAQYWGGTNSIGKTRRPVHCVMDRNGTNLTGLATGAATRVPMTRALRDDYSNFDAVNGRFVAKHPGNYLVVARATLITPTTTTYFQVTLYVNGNNIGMWDGLAEAADIAETQGVSAVVRLEDGDFVDMHVFHQSGSGSKDVNGSALATNISVTQV